MNACKNIQVHKGERRARILLNRPPLNVMNIAMMREISEAFDDLAPEIDFLVFEGSGVKAFSAGADAGDHKPERVGEMLQTFHGIFRKLCKSSVVTIAAVHGHCLGGGFELATFCDFSIAEESAKFGQPEIKLGCFPPVAMITLPQIAGMRAATDLILSGRTISAREAQQLGLVSRIVPDGALDGAVEALLNELRALSPRVLGMARRALWEAAGFNFDRRLKIVEDFYLSELIKTEDAQEGIRAFLEKRDPAWHGR